MSDINNISKDWLKNIKKLDKKNNLRTGEIYAHDGSIEEFNIKSNHVTAKVRGIPGEYYDVEIKFNKLNKPEREALENFIKSNPVIYSKILNNDIPFDELTSLVEFLPTSLKDFKMSCTCDRGLFCKHKSAIIHKIALELKKDPFLIFSLRGFDIDNITQNNNLQINTVRDVLNESEDVNLNNSSIHRFLYNLNMILSDFPSFYPSNTIDFNDVLFKILSSMSKISFKFQNEFYPDEFKEFIIIGYERGYIDFSSEYKKEVKDLFEEKWLNPQKWSQFKIDLDGNYEIIRIKNGGDDDTFIRANKKYSLFGFFAELTQIDFANYCEDIKYLHELYEFTLKLIELNALIPQFFSLDNNKYHIRWIPVFNESIYEELEYFIKYIPEKLLTFYEMELSLYNQVIALISLFFEGFAHCYNLKYMPHSLLSYQSDRYFRLFFINSQDFSQYSFKGKEIEVNKWIFPLYLSQQDYKIILNATQSNQKFFLDLNVQLNDKIYSYEDIIDLNRGDIVKNISIIDNIFLKYKVHYDFKNHLKLTLKEFQKFIDNVLPTLEDCGIEFRQPSEFENEIEVKLLLNNPSKEVSSSLTLDDLADFDWKIALGDKEYSINEFKLVSNNFRGLIKIKDKYYRISKQNLFQLQKDIHNIPKNKDTASMISYLLGSDSDNVVMDEKLNNLIDNMLNIEKVSPPKSLNDTLRDYQKDAFSWLIQNMQAGFGSILADDMGLGKTLEVLSLILYLKENNKLNDEKVLICAPTSIITNWKMEIEKFTPSLNVEIYHGQNRKFPADDYDILLTSYGVLRIDVEKFIKKNWFLFIIDEAQNIKNRNTKQTKAVKSINANYNVALSGTPIENHLGEYWSIFDFTNKGYLDTFKNFKHRFINPIENKRKKSALDDFKKITSPFILRRLKSDKSIIKELPDKIVNDIYCNLSVKQASMYDEVLEQIFSEIEVSEGINRRGLVLKLINSLKQICNHPVHFLKTGDVKIKDSGKLEVLMNILETIIESDEKVLIFTQYVEMGNILKEVIEDKFDEEVLFLHGSVSRKRRDAMIDDFQNTSVKIFILSIKAGGTGLNLTAANNVIHYDLWWNPAVENQATDRAYRIGQTKNVMVYRFITKGTLEERINQILFEKRELVDLAIGGDMSFITEMDNEELRIMLDLRNT